MPIELPNLDDRRFADLAEEGRQMISVVAPSWTDHNLSDPGITLMELFAAVTEQLIYRTNRVTAAHKEVFLKLVDPSEYSVPHTPSRDIDGDLALAVKDSRIEKRVITAGDYERQARKGGALGARCLPASMPKYHENQLVGIEKEPGHLTLVVIPPRSAHRDEAQRALEVQTLLSGLIDKLATVCAMTTDIPKSDMPPTLHLIPAQALQITATVKLVCFAEYFADAAGTVGKPASEALAQYFDCSTGGPARAGWPLGQPVYKSTLYALLSRLPGVDYIESLQLSAGGQLNVEQVLPASYEYVEFITICHFSDKAGAPT